MSILAYILITVTSGLEKKVLEEISTFDEVIEANLVIGGHDAIIKVRVEDILQLDTFLTERLRLLPDIFLTTTMIITEQFK